MFAANLFHKTKKSTLICMNNSYCILKTRIQCDFECTFDDNQVCFASTSISFFKK